MGHSLKRARDAAALALLAALAFGAAFGAVVAAGSIIDGGGQAAPAEPTPTAAASPSPIPVTSTPTATATPTDPTATATRSATPSPSPTATPVASPGWEAFGASLQAAIDGYWAEGRFAAAVTDLQTGYTVGANGTQHQLTGCVVNLFVLISAMRDVEEGRYPLSAVEGLIDATIWSSNATTAYELYRITGNGDPAAGVAKVQAIFDHLEMTESQIHHPPAYSGDGELAFAQAPDGAAGAAVPDDSNNWTTALDLNRALAAFYDGELLSRESTDDLLGRLVNVKPGLNYLTAYVPGEARVSHKNGFFPEAGGTWVDNDVGIVRVERDGVSYAYAVSFFSGSVVGKYNDVPLGQEISRLAYEYFASVYGD